MEPHRDGKARDTAARISTLSRRLRRGLWVVLIGYLIMGALALFGHPAVSVGIEILGEDVVWSEQPRSVQVFSVVSALVFLWLYVAMAYQFERLLRLFEGGAILTLATVRRIRNLGILVLLEPALMIFGGVVGLPIFLEASFEFDPYPLFVGIGILIVAHVMHLACEVSEDAALTV